MHQVRPGRPQAGLKPGMRLLDVGCGWGGMVMHAAKQYGVKAAGRHPVAPAGRVGAEGHRRGGPAELAEVRHLDYRDVTETDFDAVSSIGLTEHIGKAQLAGLLPFPARQATSRAAGCSTTASPGRTTPSRRKAGGSSTATSSPTGSWSARATSCQHAGPRLRGPPRGEPARALRDDPRRLVRQPRRALGRGGRGGRRGAGRGSGACTWPAPGSASTATRSSCTKCWAPAWPEQKHTCHSDRTGKARAALAKRSEQQQTKGKREPKRSAPNRDAKRASSSAANERARVKRAAAQREAKRVAASRDAHGEASSERRSKARRKASNSAPRCEASEPLRASGSNQSQSADRTAKRSERAQQEGHKPQAATMTMLEMGLGWVVCAFRAGRQACPYGRAKAASEARCQVPGLRKHHVESRAGDFTVRIAALKCTPSSPAPFGLNPRSSHCERRSSKSTHKKPYPNG